MNFRHLKNSFFIVTLFIFSCTSYKKVPYFQNLKSDSVLTQKINNFSPLIVQPGDLLAIHVTSLNHDADAQFNYDLEHQTPLNTGSTPNTGIDRQDQSAVVGYLVDQDGNIRLPMIGAVKVAGLNTTQISVLLESKLSDLLSKPNVNTRIQNFKISVLGDVKSPGVFASPNERITITEAITLAGDLNITGMRDNVLLIREVNGNREYVRLDLTSKDVFNSPYFYLKNNDVIYIQPNKERLFNESTSFQRISLVISIISILAILYTKK